MNSSEEEDRVLRQSSTCVASATTSYATLTTCHASNKATLKGDSVSIKKVKNDVRLSIDNDGVPAGGRIYLARLSFFLCGFAVNYPVDMHLNLAELEVQSFGPEWQFALLLW